MQNFPADLCLLSPRATLNDLGSGDSLVNLGIADLPNGALCWVIAESAFFRLDKTSTIAIPSSPYAAHSVIAPGGDASFPGRWFQLPSSSGVYSQGADSLLQASAEGALLTTLVINTWAALPAGSNFYQMDSGVLSTLWALNANSGVLTYQGPSPGLFSVRGYCSLNAAAGTMQFDFGLSLNGGSIGGTVTQPTSAEAIQTVSGKDVALSFERVISLNNGQTIQPMLRVLTTPANVQINRLHLVATPTS